MKYILMMHAPDVLPAEDLEEGMTYLTKLCEELAASGELVSTEGLAGPRQAKLVQAANGGGHEVTDGPFPETKEFLLGYWIVDCENPERAYEIAADISRIPGPGGKAANMPIEVRAVATHSGGEM